MTRDTRPADTGLIGELLFRASGEAVRADSAFRRIALGGRALPARANVLTLEGLRPWRLMELMGECATTGTVACREIEHGAGPEARRLALRLSPLEEQGGKALAYLLQAEDVTERHAAGRRLEAERDEARESARSKGQFLASMSHELRTPLNGIIGFLRLVEDGQALGEEERKDYLHSARTAAMGLLELINNILDLAKIEANRLTLESVELEPLRLAEEVAKTLAPQAHAKGVDVVCTATPEVPGTLLGDPTRLRQVLLNLAGNAVKFTDAGAVTLGIAPEVGDGALLRFAVRDTGVGIPPEVQKTLFQDFVQRDDSISRRFGGTGLGLAICRQLVEQMGGAIGVESEEGKGSTFWFRVPLQVPAAAAPAKRAPLEGARLIVLDPAPVTRQVLALNLRALGAEAVEAHGAAGAQQALEAALAAGKPVQAVLVDHHLHRDAALAFAHSVRTAHYAFRPDLVYLASIGQLGEPDAIRGGGFAALLTKPVPRAILGETVRGLIRTQTAQGSAYAPPPRRAVGELTNLAARHHVRVLVAEDNAVNQKLIHALLSKRGFQVTLVPNGKAAVQAVVEEDFDIVLMDVQMPVMDGLSATQEIRRRVEGRLPIVAMTADAMDGDRERCLGAGMDDYLSKPILPDQLNNILEHWLGRAAGDRKAGAATQGFADWGTLDHAHLDAVRAYAREHRPEAFAELLALFERELAQSLETLAAAADGGNWPAFAQGARHVAMIAEGFGAPRLQAMAREMAAHSRAAEGLLARALLVQMQVESRSLALQLQRGYGAAAGRGP